MTEDQQLLDRLKRGEKAALAEAFDRYRGPVYAKAFLTSGSRPDAEELLQDTFLLLWQKRKRVQIRGDSLLPWLLVSVHYLALNAVRSRRRRQTDVLEDEFPPAASAKLDPQLVAEGGELRDTLEAAVAQLPALDQRIFHLCVVDGLTYKEAAHHLNVSHAVVRNRLSRAKQSLRNDIAEYVREGK
ncbi:RNA polymerase sigma factor [Agromyces sp. NPDC055658]